MMMQDMAENKGAFHVEYNEFKKMYDFAMRCVIRNRRKVQIVLFTIEAPEEVQEKAMDVFIQSVISSLRNVDTGTQYSSTQYVLIIMDADLSDGREVAGRVIGRFHEINNGVLEDCRITFDIETMRPSRGI
jgi:hypothetical protein